MAIAVLVHAALAVASVRTPTVAKATKPPTINIAPLVKACDEGGPLDPACVRAIREACSHWGFFYAVGHGVDRELMDRFYDQQAKFFALDPEVKLRIKRSEANSKGWYDDEYTKNKLDWKQGFDIGAQDGDLDAEGLDGHNQWPDEAFGVPDFEPTIREYYGEAFRVARVLVRAMAVGLGMPAEAFDREFDQHTSYLRLNYYPLCPKPNDHLCISPHTDAGAVTVLTQSPVQSLQVLQGGSWVDVPPVEDAFVINTGDVMQVWSNGLYKAPLHRVITHEDKVRYSAPFFLNPNYSTNYAPMPSCVTDERPAKYRPINWGDFRMARFRGDFADVGTETQISDFEIA